MLLSLLGNYQNNFATFTFLEITKNNIATFTNGFKDEYHLMNSLFHFYSLLQKKHRQLFLCVGSSFFLDTSQNAVQSESQNWPCYWELTTNKLATSTLPDILPLSLFPVESRIILDQYDLKDGKSKLK